MRYWLTFLLILTLSHIGYAKSTQWQPLGQGLDYAVLNTPNTSGKLHAFRINLRNYQLDIVLAQDHKTPSASVKRLNDASHAVLAINGGFFSPEREPLGLRIQSGKVRHKLKTNTSWWGVFFIQNNRAYITPPRSFRLNKNISFAVQAGPRLIINGYIPSLKESFDERSALCITRKGDVIITATDGAPLSTTQLAKLLSTPTNKGGLSCYNALNLDGGTSTQLYAKIGNFQLYIPSIISVTDAIVVKPRHHT